MNHGLQPPASLWPLTIVLFLVATGAVLYGARRRLRQAGFRPAAEADWVSSLDFIQDVIYLVGLDERLIQGNRTFFEFLKLPPEEAIGRNIMALIHGEREHEPCPVCRARLERRDASFYKDADDPMNRWRRPIEIVVRVRRDRRGEPIDILMMMRDLTRQRQAEEALRESEERLMVTLESIGDAVITTDVNGAVQYLNPVAQRLTGWTRADARGRPLPAVFGLNDDHLASDLVSRCLAREAVLKSDQDSLLRHRDGREFAIEHTIAPIRNRRGEVIGAVLVFRDVTEMRAMAQQLALQATHDALTGLANRQKFEALLEEALASARLDHRSHALCYLDLDQFKIVNDTCGHIAGDQLLKQIAAVLRQPLRENDVVARLGGDEFAVLLHGCPLVKAVEIADELRQHVRDFRFVWNDRAFEMGVSIGLAEITPAWANVTEILSAVDSACYAAKDLGRNRVYVYQADDHAVARHRGEMQWVERVAHAIEQDRLRLYCQPIIALGSGLIGRYEILVRMLDEAGQPIAPMAFIPAAERYGLMPGVDRWVVQATLAALAAADAAGIGATAVSINVSGASLCDPGFLEFTADRLRRAAMAPGRIAFEITETAAIANFSQTQRFLAILHGLGCRLALDDFGSGFSSFAYLRNLPVDYLKIDGSFVRDIAHDPIDLAMVHAINQLGHAMGIETVAEFAETPEIVAELERLRVDYAQGYGLHPPQPIERYFLDAGAPGSVAEGRPPA